MTGKAAILYEKAFYRIKLCMYKRRWGSYFRMESRSRISPLFACRSSAGHEERRERESKEKKDRYSRVLFDAKYCM